MSSDFIKIISLIVVSPRFFLTKYTCKQKAIIEIVKKVIPPPVTPIKGTSIKLPVTETSNTKNDAALICLKIPIIFHCVDNTMGIE